MDIKILLGKDELKLIRKELKKNPGDMATALYLTLRVLLHYSESQAARDCRHPDELIADILSKNTNR